MKNAARIAQAHLTRIRVRLALMEKGLTLVDVHGRCLSNGIAVSYNLVKKVASPQKGERSLKSKNAARVRATVARMTGSTVAELFPREIETRNGEYATGPRRRASGVVARGKAYLPHCD